MPNEMSLWNEEAKPKMKLKSRHFEEDYDIPVNLYQQRTSTMQDVSRSKARSQAKEQKIKGGMLLQVKPALLSKPEKSMKTTAEINTCD